MTHYLTAEERVARADTILSGLAAGDPTAVIAARVGMPARSMRRWATRNLPGVAFTASGPRSRYTDEAAAAAVADLLEAGLSLPEAADRIGYTVHHLTQKIRAAGRGDLVDARAARSRQIRGYLAAGRTSAEIVTLLGLSHRRALLAWVREHDPELHPALIVHPAGPGRRPPVRDRAGDVEDLLDRAGRGDTAERIAADLRVRPGSIHRRLLRAGRLDVWARIRSNEHRCWHGVAA